MKKHFAARCLAAATLALSAAAAQAEIKWDLASGYPAFNFHTRNLAQFADEVRAATNNQLNITLHPGASLFKMPEIKRAVQGNQVQAGEFFLVSFQNEWPIFGADGLPFLTANYDEAFKLYQAQKPLLQAKLDQQGMVLLYAVAWPPQGIYSKTPIASGADLKGKKWRAYSPTTARIGELLGTQPATIQEADLAQALATGVVETLVTSSATGADNKLYENLKYYYNVQAWIPKNVVVVNKRDFAALDKATQDALLAAAAQAETRGWAMSRQVDAESIATLKANGMQVEEPSAQLRQDLQAVGTTILAEWSKQAGADGTRLMDAYRK